MMFSLVLAALVGAAFGGSTAGDGTTSDGGCNTGENSFDLPDIITCVDRHNSYRGNEEADNMNKIVWDEHLAKLAQGWANQCKWKHGDTNCDGTPIGQNMFFVAGGKSHIPTVNISTAMRLWYEEKPNYHFENRTCDDGKMCGHYTQVVWAKTRKMGCAIAYCPILDYDDKADDQDPRNASLFVCDYTPAGNYRGQDAYVKGNGGPCSQCDTEGRSGWACENDLCARCTKKGGDNPRADCNCTVLTCKNGGTYNNDTCTCDCPTIPNTNQQLFYGAYCENSCSCVDKQASCEDWARRGYCTGSYASYMEANCKESCGLCGSFVQDNECTRAST